MKKILFALLFYSCSCCLLAQNCTKTSVGYPPINDLATGSWHGSKGGLYPNGSNYKPTAHNLAGLNIASQIVPLDTFGNVDMVNGKIVWLSVGMSNTTMESQVFLPMANSFPQKNPKLILMDGAQGGQDIVIIDNPNANFWSVINQRLVSAGLSRRQVQAVWFKQAEMSPTDTAFATYPDALKLKYKTAIQLVKSKFPNTKLCYLSSRIYAGYASSALNPEPYSYYSGWSVKRLIEDQINGDTSLAYTGAKTRAPWLAWGPYTWADGTTPRADGLTWICPTDYNTDGTHPSTAGRQKVAQMLLNFFTADSTATPWFLSQPTGITNTTFSTFVELFPNPVKDILTIKVNVETKNAHIEICNVLGEIVYSEEIKNLSGNFTKQIHLNTPNGIYFIKVNEGEKQCIRKIIVQ